MKIQIKKKSIQFAKKLHFKENQKEKQIKTEIEVLEMQDSMDIGRLGALYADFKNIEKRNVMEQ